MTTVTEQPTFGVAADDLRRIADLFDKVADVRIDSSPWVCLDVQVDGTDDLLVERTDAVGQALFGKPGAFKRMSNGQWFYEVEGRIGIVKVHLYDQVSEATYREHQAAVELAAKEAELARLRAEVEQLRAERSEADR